MAKEKTIKNKIPGGVTGAVKEKIFTTSQNNNFTKVFTSVRRGSESEVRNSRPA